MIDQTVRTFRGAKVQLKYAQYGNGRLAIQLVGYEYEDPYATASVNMPDHPMDPTEIAIKNWGENEGMTAWLVREGIVNPPHRTIQTGYVEADVCRLLVEVPRG